MKAPFTCFAAQSRQTLTSAWNCSNGRPLPGTGRPFDQFQSDVSLCRDWAAKQVKGAFMDAPAFEVQRRYDNAYIQCMYAKGHQVPGRDLPARGSALPPAPQPPPR